ncbi:RNA 3'-terminal phosphate cyclase [Patescibacteria group bacterium]
MNIIEIDGSRGEDGGQILRTALSLSVISTKPCHIFNIKNPGLTNQHLLEIQALSELCDGKLEGDSLSSEEITFYPGKTYKEKVSLNIPAAKSITLVLQAVIPPSLFSPHPVRIVFDGGATDTFFSPTIDHFSRVFLKLLEKMGAKTDLNILQRGYYPEGNAQVEIMISPSTLIPLAISERGTLQKIFAISGASESLKEKKAAEKQLSGVREVLGKLKLPLEEKVEYYKTSCPGSQICLIAEFENTIIGTDNLGKMGKRAEDVGKEAALEMLKEAKSEGSLDKQTVNQILPSLALAPKKSRVSVSEITDCYKTTMWVIEQFLNGKFSIKKNVIQWIPKTN